MAKKEDGLITILYQALSSPLGVCVFTDDPERLRQKLYATRRDLGDPALDCLSFQVSPTNPSDNLWVTKREA